MSSQKKFNTIQTLRFFAAVGVAQFHLMPFVVPFQVGGAGVDIFFVISGFVIGLTPPAELATRFLLRRILRIYPIYWICTALNISVNCFIWGASALPSPALLLNSILLFPANGQWHPLYFPAWTLVYEIFFYLVYAIFLIFPVPKRNMLCAVVMFALSLTNILGDSTGNLMEFAFGLFVSEFVISGFLLSKRFAWIIIFFVVTWFVIFNNGSTFLRFPPHIARSLMWGMPCAIFVMAVMAFEGAKFFGSIFAKFGGAASYCIYLTHITAGVFVSAMLYGRGIRVSDRPFVWVPLLVFTAIVIGSIVHIVIERPLLRLFQRWFMQRDIKTAYKEGVSTT